MTASWFFRWLMIILINTTTTLHTAYASNGNKNSSDNNTTPPPFFLQDPTDSLCLAGDTFRRCSLDTLWYVKGTAGNYRIHQRSRDNDDVTTTTTNEQEDGFCLTEPSCGKGSTTSSSSTPRITLAPCSHCGAQGWNILGDSDTGYILTHNNNMDDEITTTTTKNMCLSREQQPPTPPTPPTTTDMNNSKNITTTKVIAIPCDDHDQLPTPLQLQFASQADISSLSSSGARLVAAATEGDITTVKAILEEEKKKKKKNNNDDTTTTTTINNEMILNHLTDWDGLNALIPAASNGHLELCQFLIAEGIDVNAADKDGITALMEASIMGHLDVVKLLLSSKGGATLDQTANSGITALWLAASDGQTEVVQYLLEGVADPNNSRVDDISALMAAAVGGHDKVVELLLQHGAKADATDREGLTPLMNAAEKGNVQVIQSLLKSFQANDDDDDDDVQQQRKDYVNMLSITGFNALIIASAHGNVNAVKELLNYGADVTIQSPDSGVTALMYAAANGRVDVVEVLLQEGKAPVDQKHLGGGTALLEAATGGAVEAMKILIAAGADIDLKDEDGVSALMGIASQCDLEGQKMMVKALQDINKFDAELNRMSFSGGTPIMFAAAGGHTDCVNHFVELGAIVDARSKATPEYLAKMEKAIEAGTTPPDQERHVDDVTALHVAAQSGHLECAKALLAAGADPLLVDAEGRSALTMAIKGNYGEVALALIEGGADPNQTYTDEDENNVKEVHNLLFDAIMVENEKFALALMEKGADIYYKDDKKVTTLLQASHRGLTTVVEKLLEVHKANKEKKSTYLDDGSDEAVTPLIAASSEGHEAVVELLLKAGATVDAKDVDGTTALMAAAARGHLPIVRSLITIGKANVNAQNDDGHSALMFAYNGKTQVETLMERYNQYVEEEKLSHKQQDGSETNKQLQQQDIVDDGGTGPLIREALSNHTALVDFLLSNGADTTMKDKEGHVAKDFDYHPDATTKTTTTLGSSSSSSNSNNKDGVKEEL